ncbi:uncharacterized membrane protein YciS (DUF1049 family) [Ensifer sp. KUDG1]
MHILLTLFCIWLVVVALGWTILGIFWLCQKISDFENWCNRKIAERFGV